MRRSKNSLLKAFGIGMLWAGAGTAAVFGVHFYLAPPADTSTSDHVTTTLAELVPGIARWAQLPTAATPPEAGQPVALTVSSRADAGPAPSNEAELRDAQTRVAKRQADVQAQRILVRSIQQELIRVGCYSGAIDGQWSDGTRGAMGAFVERLNVRLPLSAPDYILLTMLQGHSQQACSPVQEGDKSIVAAAVPARPGAPLPPRQVPPRQVSAKQGPSNVATGSEPMQEAAAGQGVVAHVTPTEQFRTSVSPAPSLIAKQQDGKQQARRPADVRVTTAQQPAPAPTPQFVAPYVASPYVAPAEQLPGRMAVGAPAIPQAPPAYRGEIPTGVPQAVAIVPPAPAARVPQAGPATSRPEPVRAAASPQRQNNGGGNRGGGNGGGGGSRGEVFSRLGSSAP